MPKQVTLADLDPETQHGPGRKWVEVKFEATWIRIPVAAYRDGFYLLGEGWNFWVHKDLVR